MIEKLNPVAAIDPKSARWLGHGAVLALYGVIVAGTLLVRARTRRAAGPNLLDLAVIAAGIVGVVAMGDRLIHRRGAAPEEPEEPEGDRFSHPAINVQRISFA